MQSGVPMDMGGALPLGSFSRLRSEDSNEGILGFSDLRSGYAAGVADRDFTVRYLLSFAVPGVVRQPLPVLIYSTYCMKKQSTDHSAD